MLKVTSNYKIHQNLFKYWFQDFMSLWHGRPCKTLQYSDARFWVEFFHSCQEAMFSMLPVCIVMITKQYKRKTNIFKQKSEEIFFSNTEDQNCVRNIPDVLRTSSVTMFTYRKATMACYSSIVALKPMTTKRIKQGIINFSKSKCEIMVGRMLFTHNMPKHLY